VGGRGGKGGGGVRGKEVTQTLYAYMNYKKTQRSKAKQKKAIINIRGKKINK
jgi:hypothetical protein